MSPDGRSLVENDFTSLRVIDVETGAVRWEERGLPSPMSSVAFSPDGLALALGGTNPPVQLRELATGRSIRDFQGIGKAVTRLAFSIDGRRMVTATDAGTIQVWNASIGQETLKLAESLPRIVDLGFLPDGSGIVATLEDGRRRRWSTARPAAWPSSTGAWEPPLSDLPVIRTYPPAIGQPPETQPGATPKPMDADQGVEALAFNRDGTEFVIGGRDKTIVLSSLAGRKIREFRGHQGWITAVAYGAGERLASASYDGTIRIWDLTTGDCLRTLSSPGNRRPVKALAFHPDGRQLASSGRDRVIRLWDVETGEVRREYRGHLAEVDSLSFSPDGLRLASSDTTNVTLVQDLAPGFPATKLEGRRAVFSPDGSWLATYTSSRSEVVLRDAKTIEARKSFPWTRPSSVRLGFSTDGRNLAAAGSDGTIVVWHCDRDAVVTTLRGPANELTAILFLPGGSRIATSGKDGAVRLWDLVAP